MGMHWSHWQCQLHQIPDIPQTCAKSTSYEFGEIIWVPRQTFRIRSLLISTGVRKKTKSNINHPVGGFSPTHLKNMRKSNWEASSPNIRGENSPRKICELPPAPIVIFGRLSPRLPPSVREPPNHDASSSRSPLFQPRSWHRYAWRWYSPPGGPQQWWWAWKTRPPGRIAQGDPRWVIPNKNPPKPSIKHEKWWEQPTDSKWSPPSWIMKYVFVAESVLWSVPCWSG